ncbi:orotate phosphoribosyltransferase [Egibacter rhizosphaerae]|uniref:Orotate phosphoribosyltransferase n=1 Tax=Egibacter rhizosphaerae TaxID=1670831 RepID=A0A411YLQ7_9ACTN|nr:orotate phosphoribosyltransferase [Egibacter rhizosphaerae]
MTARLEALEVLQRGHFRLSSGTHSDTYLQLARALQHPDLALELGRALAGRARDRAPDVVASPALGGVLAGFATAAALGVRFVFAERGRDGDLEFRRGQGPEAGERALVVEDVITTGGSAREVEALLEAHGASSVGHAAIVDRSAGVDEAQRPSEPPLALVVLEPATWDPEDCPACAAGRPLDAPGSRHRG